MNTFMQPDWNYVKKTTLWHYEDLIKKLSVLKAYPVIWKAYNHNLAQATIFAMHLFPDKNIEAGEYPAQILDTIAHLKHAGISDWGNLLAKIATRKACMAFVTENKLNFEKFLILIYFVVSTCSQTWKLR